MRCLRRWYVLLGSLVLAVSGCGGDEPEVLAEPVIGGDLVVMMQPGEGTETNTGRYFVEMFDWEGNFGLQEGTANHVGWVEREFGPVHIVAFTAGRQNPRGGAAESCVIYFPGSGSCTLDPEEPAVFTWRDQGSSYGAEVFGGPDCVEAVITTRSGNTVAILTVEGFAYAEWARDWGEPQTVDFYNAAGVPLSSLDFELESGG
jgi:hypothetical protein